MPKKKTKKRADKESNKNKLKLLLSLIVIVVVIDAVSLFYYFDQGPSESPDLPTCEDETTYGSCSNEKPFYCHEGQLLKKAFTCGCPEGTEVNFQDCV